MLWFGITRFGSFGHSFALAARVIIPGVQGRGREYAMAPGVTSIDTPMLPNSEASTPATAAMRNVPPLRLGVGPSSGYVELTQEQVGYMGSGKATLF
jgi:hypothetical protein